MTFVTAKKRRSGKLKQQRKTVDFPACPHPGATGSGLLAPLVVRQNGGKGRILHPLPPGLNVFANLLGGGGQRHVTLSGLLGTQFLLGLARRQSVTPVVALAADAGQEIP